jgi:hypothetical protein
MFKNSCDKLREKKVHLCEPDSDPFIFSLKFLFCVQQLNRQKYIPTKASGNLHEGADVSVWQINRMVSEVVSSVSRRVWDKLCVSV